ncbi:MAG TPA: phosphoglycerate mutase [Hydrogenophaga sp.]|uniref:phosphoglycerate mutase n=1 Tax=Hydrogenophaga sp. TaxID=1904254 RepID=UPI002BD04F73|nr:phosphoglycerate mutase [Hydrogenophaga sp.]HMN93975.1 phosphoglycerate mutase [Hydrogenophaga sp.]
MPAPQMAPDTPPPWIVPFAAASAPGCQTLLPGLQLPNLQALLDRLTPQTEDEGTEHSLSPPHERALAQALGLPVRDGQLPWAAADSDAPGTPQAWFSPCHFQIGIDQVTLLPADQIGLDETGSRALLAALAPLCEEDGMSLQFVDSGRWRASGEPLRGLVCASLDRVSGRPVGPWLTESPDNPQGHRLLQRLQSEAQMLFYTLPVNDTREAACLLPVNGFWVHGAGACEAPERLQPAPRCPDSLRQAALRDDWAAWQTAWQALDTGLMAELLRATEAGHPVHLTLCGERHARTWATPGPGQAGSLWQRLRARWRRPDPVGETLALL